jgi:hypoxanthine phosphoribosyltransferase
MEKTGTEDSYKERFPDKLLHLDIESLKNDVDFGRVQLLITSFNSHRPWKDMENLANGIVGLSNLIVTERPDTLVLLDKSARPVAHFLKNLWREAYTDFEGIDIRFINVGRESEEKDSNKKYLKQLFSAHTESMIGKKVIVADEIIVTGDSINRAKDLLEKVFPDTRKVIYTAIFHSIPEWYNKNQYLGVYDLNHLPLEKIPEFEDNNHIAKTISGIVRRHPDLIDDPVLLEHGGLRTFQNEVNEIRAQLSYFSKKVAGHCEMVPLGSEVVRPILPYGLGFTN